jgi:S-adenosylmethionine/arginine decarboxylase-like enzyme
MTKPEVAFAHHFADFIGVAPAHLRDATLIRGLLIAAAGAAGISAAEPPVVRVSPGEGIDAYLLAEGAHVGVHTVPAKGLLLLDVLVPAANDAGRAIDVFTRRLGAREVRREGRPRG